MSPSIQGFYRNCSSVTASSSVTAKFTGNCCTLHVRVKKRNWKKYWHKKIKQQKLFKTTCFLKTKQLSKKIQHKVFCDHWWKMTEVCIGTIYTCTTVMLSLPTVLIGPPYCSCWAAWASSWICCCCWVGVIRRKSWGSSPTYTWKTERKNFKLTSPTFIRNNGKEQKTQEAQQKHSAFCSSFDNMSK